MFEVYDIDKEILYWIEQFDFKWIDSGKLIDYIKKHYVKDADFILEQWCEVHEWKVDIDYLNHNMIISQDNDYEYVGNGLWLNTYWLESSEEELRELGLIK